MGGVRYRAHMLVVIVAATLSVSASCEQRCASDADRCYSNCRSSAKCSRTCEGRSVDCNARCSKAGAKAEAKADAQSAGIPCGVRKGKDGSNQIRPCTDAESKLYRDALNSPEAQKALKCRDEQGLPTPCKADLEKSEEVVKAVGSDGICRDASGRPQLCPEAQQRVEKSVKTR